MLSRQEIADALRDVSAIKVAERAGVSSKTVYRLRDPLEKISPRLDIVERCLRAAESIRAGASKTAQAKAA